MLGVMLKTVKLTGTSLFLNEGTVVNLRPASNIPNGKDMAFASPHVGWLACIGIDASDEDSILLDRDDFAGWED